MALLWQTLVDTARRVTVRVVFVGAPVVAPADLAAVMALAVGEPAVPFWDYLDPVPEYGVLSFGLRVAVPRPEGGRQDVLAGVALVVPGADLLTVLDLVPVIDPADLWEEINLAFDVTWGV